MNVSLVPDYLDIVKSPMDFSSMEKKLYSYCSLDEFTQDFQLIISNAKLYNSPNSIYFIEAEKLYAAGMNIISKESSKLNSIEPKKENLFTPSPVFADEQEEVDILQDDEAVSLMKRKTDGKVVFSSVQKNFVNFESDFIKPVQIVPHFPKTQPSSFKSSMIPSIARPIQTPVKVEELKQCKRSKYFRFDSYKTNLSVCDYNSLCCLAGDDDFIAYFDSSESFACKSESMKARMKRKIAESSRGNYERIKNILLASKPSTKISQILAELYLLQKERFLSNGSISSEEAKCAMMVKSYLLEAIPSLKLDPSNLNISELINVLIDGRIDLYYGNADESAVASNSLMIESMFMQ